SDNGYIAIGKARPDMGGSTNKMWIIKVDSMGCDTPGCATGTFIHEFSPSGGGWGEELKVWPNPTTGKFEVWSSRFEGEGNKIIRIYNSQGFKVEEIDVPDDKETLTIDVHGWKKGIYFLRLLINGEERGSKKIIVN
ncbi:MAG: T9SS type A sorting domain-containing protein, partial [Bacteroidales bacterium]|nr:T9SS type A sorting domain-containing protein [Bacteroidales bacterium]